MSTDDLLLATSANLAGSTHVFAVFGSQQSAELDARIRSIYDDSNVYTLPNGDWLVADPATKASLVYDRLAGDQGDSITMIVARLVRPYGFYDTAMWDWIEAKENGKS